MLTKMRFPSFRVSSGPVSLDQILPSTVFDLDATIAASYPGTGTTWANLVPAPADGSAQTDYDFELGGFAGLTTYPTFTGTPGDPAAYWAFDGGDYFSLKSGTNTPFINALNKTTGTQTFWVAVGFFGVLGNGQCLYDTRQTSSNVGSLMQHGSTEGLLLGQRGDTLTVSRTSSQTGLTGDLLFIASYNQPTDQVRMWIHGAGTTYGLTYNATTADASNPMIIGAGTNGISAFLANGARMYSFAMGNEYLDDTKAAAIIAALEARHNRDYS